MLDAMGGGNQRSLLCAWTGHDAISNDVWPDVAVEGELRQEALQLPGNITLTTGDARNLLSQPTIHDALGRITHSVGSWSFGLQ